MLGYHDSNRCAFDLWSPVTAHQYSPDADPEQEGYGVWEDTPYHTAVENRAFSAYAFHTSQLDEIAASIAAGEENLSVSDDLTSDDLRYIEDQLRTRYGIEATLNFD
jgi:hypothetical protein